MYLVQMLGAKKRTSTEPVDRAEKGGVTLTNTHTRAKNAPKLNFFSILVSEMFFFSLV